VHSIQICTGGIPCNGCSFLHLINSHYSVDCHNYRDTSGTWGCGAFYTNEWFQYAWTANWSGINIMAKEVVPIVISCAIWGPVLDHWSSLQLYRDGFSIKNDSWKDNITMHLLRCILFFVALFQIRIMATHIPGMDNVGADMLSRNYLP